MRKKIEDIETITDAKAEMTSINMKMNALEDELNVLENEKADLMEKFKL